MFSVYELLPSPPPIGIVDVGAMWLGEGDILYRNLLARPGTTVVGFEPIRAECDKLNAMNRPGHLFLPYVIGDGTERTFYLTNSAMTSSMYEPNTELLRQFTGLEEITRVVSTSKVATHRLDDLNEIERCDYLKIDVQGGELDVLKGATRLLESVAIVQCEVEFVPMYKDQPLFADVDAFMRSRGFMLHRFSPPSSSLIRPFSAPRTAPNQPRPAAATGTQVLWADAVYIPDISRLHEQSPERLLRAAIALHEVFRHADVVAHLLLHHDRLAGTDLWSPYLQRLTGRVPPRPALG